MLKGSARLTDCTTPWQRRKRFFSVAAKQALPIAGSAAQHHLGLHTASYHRQCQLLRASMHVLPVRSADALAVLLLCLVCDDASTAADLKGNTCLNALTSSHRCRLCGGKNVGLYVTRLPMASKGCRRGAEGVHTNLDPLASGGIDNGVALAHRAAVDAHVGQLPKPALLKLECQGYQRTLRYSTASSDEKNPLWPSHAVLTVQTVQKNLAGE